MQKRVVILSPSKFRSIDFSLFKCVKKHRFTHHDNAFLSMMKMNYKQRYDVDSGVYYKDGYLIEVLNFRGKCAVTCKELYKAHCEILNK